MRILCFLPRDNRLGSTKIRNTPRELVIGSCMHGPLGTYAETLDHEPPSALHNLSLEYDPLLFRDLPDHYLVGVPSRTRKAVLLITDLLDGCPGASAVDHYCCRPCAHRGSTASPSTETRSRALTRVQRQPPWGVPQNRVRFLYGWEGETFRTGGPARVQG